jgi:hypothetical protein
LRRTWTDWKGTFAFDSYVHNQWDAVYRGAVRLTLFNGVEIAAVNGLYDGVRPLVPNLDGSNVVCLECDCHTGMRRLASGGVAGCGRPDTDARPDLDACECPHARSILFRPLADGVVNANLRDQNDWRLIGENMCSILRGCSECVPPGTACITMPPEPCTLPGEKPED